MNETQVGASLMYVLTEFESSHISGLSLSNGPGPNHLQIWISLSNGHAGEQRRGHGGGRGRREWRR